MIIQFGAMCVEGRLLANVGQSAMANATTLASSGGLIPPKLASCRLRGGTLAELMPCRLAERVVSWSPKKRTRGVACVEGFRDEFLAEHARCLIRRFPSS
jgi:hypothetical protein